MAKHAVYATAVTPRRKYSTTFRVGQPVSWGRAQDRWLRLDDRRRAGIPTFIRWMRRRYFVQYFEVRAVDENGRGIGSERHLLALTIPYRLLVSRKGA